MHPATWLRIAIGLVGMPYLRAAPAHAQSGLLRGVVTDSARSPIADADVGIVALRRLTRTDNQGRFVFARLQRGDFDVSVRRIGYQPATVRINVGPGTLDTLRVSLLSRPVTLSSVQVSATEVRRREGIEDFHRRRVRGIGTFITLEQIQKRHSGTTSDLLRSVPGLRVVRLRGGGKGVRFMPTSITPRDCMPMIWIDGQKAPGLEVDDIPFTDIEGIEIYGGPATTPMQFSQAQSSFTCGTIVIWTRNPGG